MNSLRSLINERLNEVRTSPDMPPSRADEISTELSSMVSQVLDHVADLRQYAYSVKIVAIEDDMTLGKAEAHMKASPAYADYKKAEGLYVGMIETIRSLRSKVRRAEENLKEKIV